MKREMASVLCRRFIGIFVLVIYSGLVAAAPPLINYQGFLTDAGGQPLNDVMSVTFRIWTTLESQPGTWQADLIWAEKHEAVSVVDGRINVILGTGTPVVMDLEAAQNAADDLGQAFQEDVTYIGITLNDNEQYDPGEEISPRQQLLSVPYALNASNTIIDVTLPDGANEQDYIGKVVEVLPQSNQVRLAQDYVWQLRQSHRGVYISGSRMQTSGVCAIERETPLTPGLPVYLSNAVAGEVVDATAEEMQANTRVAATKIGIPVDEDRVALTIQPVGFAANPLPEVDRFPLVNPMFLDGPAAWINANTVTNDCGGKMMASRGGALIQQQVEIKPYLKPLVDAGALQVRFGGRVYHSQGSGWPGRFVLQFQVTPPEGSPGVSGVIAENLDFSVTPACAEHQKTVAVPPYTVAITFGWEEPIGSGFWVGDLLLELIPFESME